MREDLSEPCEEDQGCFAGCIRLVGVVYSLQQVR